MYSDDIHKTKKKQKRSRRAKSYIASCRSYRISKNTILTVIALAMLSMLLFVIYNLIATPEHLIKKQIDSLARDYYENYIYATTLSNNSIDVNHPEESSDALNKIFSRYTELGFSQASLRQLLLFNDGKYASLENTFSKYCDLDRTSIKIYPEAPFGRTNYHIDYNYSCKFQ